MERKTKELHWPDAQNAVRRYHGGDLNGKRLEAIYEGLPTPSAPTRSAPAHRGSPSPLPRVRTPFRADASVGAPRWQVLSGFAVGLASRLSSGRSSKAGSWGGSEVSLDFREWCAISEDTAEAFRNTIDPVALAEFDFPELIAQSTRLRGSDRIWVPRARVARAVRAGIFARGRLEGQAFSSQSESPGIPYRNTIYVVLKTGTAQGRLFPCRRKEAMAHGAVREALSAEAVRALASSAVRTLPQILVPLTEELTSDFDFVLGCVVHTRAGGFMVAFPQDELVQAALELIVLDAADGAPIYHEGTVGFETTRGRRAGEITIQLVDLPWVFAAAFRAMGRMTIAQRQRLVGFTLDGTEGRPVKASVHELAAAWIDSMDPDTAQEYVTGEEFEDPDVQAAPSTPASAVQGPPSDVHRLQQRVAELETALLVQKQQSAPVAGPPPRGAVAGKAPALFGNPDPAAQMSAQEWGQLQLLAGGPPPRLGAAERRRTQVNANPPPLLDLGSLDVDREAAELEPVARPDAAVADLVNSSADPLHKLLALQLQQNQALMQKVFANRSTDPVLGALSGGGGDSGSGSSSSGVKGCLAREAFLRAVQELPKVAAATRVNALRELGMDPQREDGSLIRKYMERRMPLADHRLLTYFTAMIAEAWSIGYQSGNVEMLGILSRMLFFTEQCALDSGRTQVAWLLTGWQDPAFHLLTNAKRLPGMQPYARLCHPAWVSANIAFLKDMDFLESRLQSLPNQKHAKAKTEDGERQPKAQPKPRPKKKGLGKGAPEAQTSNAAGQTA
eukprot:s198_g32.t1